MRSGRLRCGIRYEMASDFGLVHPDSSGETSTNLRMPATSSRSVSSTTPQNCHGWRICLPYIKQNSCRRPKNQKLLAGGCAEFEKCDSLSESDPFHIQGPLTCANEQRSFAIRGQSKQLRVASTEPITKRGSIEFKLPRNSHPAPFMQHCFEFGLQAQRVKERGVIIGVIASPPCLEIFQN